MRNLTKNEQIRSRSDIITEKRLGIPADYQVKVLQSRNFFLANWHYNKWVVLEKILNPQKHERVLDLGTGAGNFELLFADKYNGITGVDYNKKALDFLSKELKKRKIGNVKLVASDILRLDKNITKEKFDVILMVDVIEHLNYKQIGKLVKLFTNLLKPNGRVVIITPNYGSLWVVIEWLVDKLHLVPKMAGEQHLSKFNSENLNKIFTGNGFKTVKLSTFNLLSFILPIKSLSRAAARAELMNPLKIGNLLVGVFK